MRAELGWIGLVLLADRARGAARGGGRRGSGARDGTRTRPSSPPAIALLVHAAVDWDWEMPALFVWFFGAAGVVLAAPADAARALPAPRRLTRLLAGLACLLAGGDAGDGGDLAGAAQPQRRRRSTRGDCATATDAALDSLDALPRRRRSRSRCWAGATRAPVSPSWRSTAMRAAQRARPRQLAVRLRARGRPGARGRGSAAAPRSSRCGSTRSSRCAQRSSARLRLGQPPRGGGRWRRGPPIPPVTG